MIYTVTLNPAIDKTAVIENFCAGAVNRIGMLREDAGGKGINVSKCLKNLGESSTAAMILAGDAGRRLEKMLDHMQIPTLAVWAEGGSRTNLKIIDPVRKENTDINEPGPAVSNMLLEELKGKLGEKILPGDLVILSGSLPAGVDRGLYGLLSQPGRPGVPGCRWRAHETGYGSRSLYDKTQQRGAGGSFGKREIVPGGNGLRRQTVAGNRHRRNCDLHGRRRSAVCKPGGLLFCPESSGGSEEHRRCGRLHGGGNGLCRCEKFKP